MSSTQVSWAAGTDARALVGTLTAGNERYLKDAPKPKLGRTLAGRKQLVENGQQPPVCLLSCADSRVVPEMIFDADVGELFVVRVAGNVVSKDSKGSIEYAVNHLKSKIVLVMGHTHCGAVKAAMSAAKETTQVRAEKVGAKSGAANRRSALEQLVGEVVLGPEHCSAVASGSNPQDAAGQAGCCCGAGQAADCIHTCTTTVEQNVRGQIDRLRKEFCAEGQETGVIVRGAVFDMMSGEVRFL